MAKIEFSNLKEGIKQHLKKLCTELGADLVTFYFYDKPSNQFFFPVSYGLYDEEDFERGIPNMNRPLGQVAQKSREVFAEDVNVSGLAGPFSYNEKVASLAALPLKRKKDVFGVVFINYRQAHSFPEEEQKRIRQTVNSFASEITRLTQQINTNNLVPAAITKEIQWVYENTILQEIAHKAVGVLEDSTIIIWLPDKKTLRCRVISGVSMLAQNVPLIDVTTRDPVARAFKQGKSVSIDDARKIRGFVLADLRDDLRWRAIEAVPIRNSQNETLGVIAAYATVHLKFTLHEKAILRALAESAAYNLENEKKIDSLNALHALGTRLTLPLNLKETLSEIVTSTPRVIGVDICTIHLYDAAKQEFEDVDKSAVYGASAQNMNKPGKGGVAHRVIERTWVLSEDVPDETFDASSTFVRQENVRAYAGVSLQVVNEPVGVMFVSYRQPHKFSADERTLLRTISFYAATAIYVAKLFEQRDAFAEIARDITNAHNRTELLAVVLDRSLELLGSEYGAIGLYNAETKEIRIEYAVGTEAHVIPATIGLTQLAIRTGQPVRVDDVRQEVNYFSRRPDTRSELDVPLKRGEQVIGVLNVETSRLAAYTEEHEKLAFALAAQTVVALDKIELLEQTQAELNRRVADIEVLQEVYGALETEELEDSLSNLVTRTLALTGADYGAIYLLDRSASEPMLLLAALPEGRATEDQRQERISVNNSKGILPHVVNTGKSYRSDNVLEDEHYFAIHADTRSELIAPLVFNNRVYGAIDLESTQLNWFNEREEQLVQAIAGAAAAAVRQVHLFEDLEEVNRLSEQLNSTSFKKVQEVLELIHRSANKLMDTNNMYIALYDDYSDVVRFGLMYELGEKVDVETDYRYQPRKAGQGKTEEIIHTKKPIFHPTGKEHWGWYKEKEGRIDYSEGEAKAASWIGVPMLPMTR
ncbi:MAG: GAF domain-containing protein [Chloroflexi bacterium]|nr:GAF domain-containing protein [Chloroflexota bacterium]